MKLDKKTCIRVCVSIFVLFLCIRYWDSLMGLLGLVLSAATPLLIGCVVAYLVNILMRAYERYYFPKTRKKALIKSRRPVCMVAAFITLVAVVALILVLILPQLLACVQLLFAEVPGAIKDAIAWLQGKGIIPENILDKLAQIDWRSRIGQILQALTAGIGGVADVVIGAVSSVFSGVVTALLSVIFAIYLLSGKEKLSAQFIRVGERYLMPKWMEKTLYVLATAHDCFGKYIVGQCVEALILGGLCAVGMMILQLPYAAMVGALMAFTALIPVAGAYIGAGVGAFMIFTVSPVKAIIFLVFIVVLQQVEGNVIYPRVVGSSMGLPGIWVLAAVTVGGGILGIAGMLLGVPLAATLYRLLRDDVYRIKAAAPEDCTPPEAEQTE